MIYSDILIIGGGPAGASCARILRKNGADVLLLDKKRFPRPKLCAGWITPRVFKLLGVGPDAYPHPIRQFDRLHYHVFNVPFSIRTRQYAIRRVEFDHWLLKRAMVPVKTHTVKTIVKKGNEYIIDDQFRCRYLVGAGGTHCPVFKTFFSTQTPRPKKSLISAVEIEYQTRAKTDECHLWFFNHGLPGYAWYVPKENGWLNIGIGGKSARLKTRGKTIMDHWRLFTKDLFSAGLIDTALPAPKGHTYHLNHGRTAFQKGNAFVIGDAAGLSTIDMGEGICAAIESGILAAKSICGNTPFQPAVSRFSLPQILFHKWINPMEHRERT